MIPGSVPDRACSAGEPLRLRASTLDFKTLSSHQPDKPRSILQQQPFPLARPTKGATPPLWRPSAVWPLASRRGSFSHGLGVGRRRARSPPEPHFLWGLQALDGAPSCIPRSSHLPDLPLASSHLPLPSLTSSHLGDSHLKLLNVSTPAAFALPRQVTFTVLGTKHVVISEGRRHFARHHDLL